VAVSRRTHPISLKAIPQSSAETSKRIWRKERDGDAYGKREGWKERERERWKGREEEKDWRKIRAFSSPFFQRVCPVIRTRAGHAKHNAKLGVTFANLPET